MIYHYCGTKRNKEKKKKGKEEKLFDNVISFFKNDKWKKKILWI